MWLERDTRSKALCPINNVALLDHTLARLVPHTMRVAVNAHAHADLIAAHLAALPELSRPHLSLESIALGTAGALGLLRPWLGGSPVLVLNADTYVHESAGTDSLALLLEGWSGETVRLLVVETGAASDFGTLGFAGASLMPAELLSDLRATPSGLYEMVWRPAELAGRLELITTAAQVLDCGTPLSYLEANLLASGGVSVVGAGAVVEGEIDECVIWPGARVEAHERLSRVIRLRAGATTLTVAAEHRPKLTGG